MNAHVANHLDEIRRLCAKHGVQTLELYGSAAGSEFDPVRSDVDLIVTFTNPDLGPWMKRFFDLRDELESTLGVPVDLAMPEAATNSFVAGSIAASKVPLYAAA